MLYQDTLQGRLKKIQVARQRDEGVVVLLTCDTEQLLLGLNLSGLRKHVKQLSKSLFFSLLTEDKVKTLPLMGLYRDFDTCKVEVEGPLHMPTTEDEDDTSEGVIELRLRTCFQLLYITCAWVEETFGSLTVSLGASDDAERVKELKTYRRSELEIEEFLGISP